MEGADKRNLFETMPVSRALISLAIPTIVSQIINLVYNLVDSLFIGRTGNSYMMAGVTVVLPLYMMTVGLAGIFGAGGGSLIARLIGKQDEVNAKRVSAFCIVGAGTVAVAYSILTAAFMGPLLRLLGASADTEVYCRQYAWTVVVCGNLPVVLSMTCAHLLRNAGYAKQASAGLSGGGLLNLVLDPLFMFVLLPKGMEVLGAAAATVLSNVASCIYLLLAVRRLSPYAPVSIRPSDMKGLRRRDLKELFAVGLPSALLTILFDVASIFLNALMSGHSDQEVAAIGIVLKTERIPNAVNIGLCQGMLPLVAYNYAQGNWARMRSTIRTARRYGLCVSVLCAALFFAFAPSIIGVFMNTRTGDAAQALTTIGAAAVFLRIRAFATPAKFLNYHSSFCLQAMGDGKSTMFHAIARELVLYIPIMYIFDRMLGANGLAGALIFSELLGAAFAVYLLYRRIRKCSVGV